MKHTTNKSQLFDALLLGFCAAVLVGAMLLSRFLRGDFTKTTFVHAPVVSSV